MNYPARVSFVVLCAVLLIFGVGNLSDRPVQADSLEYLALGLNLADTGEYQLPEGAPGYHRREPGMPVVIALTSRVLDALGVAPVAADCAQRESALSQTCRSAYLPLKVLQVICLLAGAVFAMLVIREIGAPWFVQALAVVLLFLDAALIYETHRFTSEILAGALMALVALCAIRALRRQSNGYAHGCGVALACLVLTKVVFAYLWIILGATLVLLLRRRQVPWRRTAVLVASFVLGHCVLVGGYMTRNLVQSGQFELTENLSYPVLAVRANYNEMTNDEYLHGFGLYTPGIGVAGFQAAEVPAEAFARLVPVYRGSFRQLALNDIEAATSGLRGAAREEAIARIREEAISTMMSDPLAHLKVSVLLAYRGIFTSRGWGYGFSPEEETLAQKSGWSVPRIGVPLHPWLRTILDLLLFASLFGVAVVGLVKREYGWLLLLALPALYVHGVYSLVSHFLPRYALPELFVRGASLVCLAYWFFHNWRKQVSDA